MVEFDYEKHESRERVVEDQSVVSYHLVSVVAAYLCVLRFLRG